MENNDTNLDKVVRNDETLYVYLSGSFQFAYVGSPVKLWPMGDLLDCVSEE